MHSFEGLEHALSLERFGRYLQWAGGDRTRALELYLYNTRVSEAFYTPLQMLEVALRNRIHDVLSARYGEFWFDEPRVLVGADMRKRIDEARTTLSRMRRPETPGRLVAALTFGFWTGLFGSDYETLWQRALYAIAQRDNGKGLRRKDFSAPIGKVRDLRNRIAHHEPILHEPLGERYASIVQLTRWLVPAGAQWCETYSVLPQVLAGAPTLVVEVKPAEPLDRGV
ncbi:Abi family protein [Aerolutibacter ruishenii]|uniref:Abi-like protein n=1 Tax=Aerolutibacter ruishenii TaxID=686800 RepID=A0A562LFI5_9GAMM|nr:Abi family protein [Lysobacter ruishenii]TWI06382.1 Abi-like protein [Lysobacter ruishenii]